MPLKEFKETMRNSFNFFYKVDGKIVEINIFDVWARNELYEIEVTYKNNEDINKINKEIMEKKGWVKGYNNDDIQK